MEERAVESVFQEPSMHIIDPMPEATSRPTFLIGISGSSSSGKTTLAHLLSMTIPPSTPVFIIHQDDFRIAKHLLVPTVEGQHDVDGRDAVDFVAMKRVLAYAKNEGRLPPRFQTSQPMEEREHAGLQISQDVIDELRSLLINASVFGGHQPVGIIDGGLLYHDPEIRDILDFKLFLRTTKETSRQRRMERTADGEFWQTEEYFNDIAWPNFEREHSPLFQGGDVEGPPNEQFCDGLRIAVQSPPDQTVEETLRWAVQTIAASLSQPQVEQLRVIETEEVVPTKVKQHACEICETQRNWVGKFRRALFHVV